MPVLSFSNLGQSFGAVDVFGGLLGSVPHGAKIGLVGPNGIGKTTLLHILVGMAVPTSGEVYIAKGTRVGYLQQEAVDAFVDQAHTVYEEMLTVFAYLRAQAAKLREMETQMADVRKADELFERYGAAQEAFELAGGYDYELRIQQVLTGLGFKGEQQHMPLDHCSGGQKTRALLARLLLEKPDLLVLDEPTNHLDVDAVEWLEGMLKTWDGAILIASHDRYFLDRVVDTIWEMTRGGMESYRGNYTAYLRQRDERWERRDQEFEATIEFFLKELDYVKRNIARASTTAQAQGRLRRLVRGVKAVELAGPQALQGSWLQFTEAYDVSKTKWNVAEVEQQIKALPSPNPRHHQLKMRLQMRKRGGNIVLRTRDLRVGYPNVSLFESEDIELLRGECAALIGANGTGKSTFLRTLMGQIEPLGGELCPGANLEIGYFAQAYHMLDAERSVLDELLTHKHMLLGEARSYLARFLFREDDVFKAVRALSGGERSRLALAVLALNKGNLLLLDEPTNHLDLPAQEALQEALSHYEGTILLVSHDRYLIDALATQIWELRDDRLHVHRGDYQSFLAERQQMQERVKREAIQDRRSNVRLPVVQRPGSGENVVRTEDMIEEIEQHLAQLGQDLIEASEAQSWTRVRALNVEYQEAQFRLDALLVQWEAMTA
ncbi:MAG: ABC-F family ATP-binding cassette domain-containing protein [Anaerolineae bacterium]|nr:ABC-F family ATP-binding cassette domain-containing protein [Anaerolineae bacterium]